MLPDYVVKLLRSLKLSNCVKTGYNDVRLTPAQHERINKPFLFVYKNPKLFGMAPRMIAHWSPTQDH